MSSHGVSRPGAESHELPTKMATLAWGISFQARRLHHVGDSREILCRSPGIAQMIERGKGVVLPPPNCVMSDSTGAVFAVSPFKRRSTMPQWSTSALENNSGRKTFPGAHNRRARCPLATCSK